VDIFDIEKNYFLCLYSFVDLVKVLKVLLSASEFKLYVTFPTTALANQFHTLHSYLGIEVDKNTVIITSEFKKPSPILFYQVVGFAIDNNLEVVVQNDI
jgi:hypothetical protein